MQYYKHLLLKTIAVKVVFSGRFGSSQHYNADDFSDEPVFNIVYYFNIAN